MLTYSVPPGYTLTGYTEREWQRRGHRIYATEYFQSQSDPKPEARESRIIRLIWHYEQVGLRPIN